MLMMVIFFVQLKGGKSTRIVNCILALKAYSEWKQGGGSGSWKFGAGSLKPTSSGKYFIRKNLEPFMNSFSRTSSASEKSLESLSSERCVQGDICSELNATVSELPSSRFMHLSLPIWVMRS